MLYNRTRIIEILCFLFISIGCVKETNRFSSDWIDVDVLKGEMKRKNLQLQEFMDVEYIPLETTDEFVNQGVVQCIGKEYILVKNINNSDGNIYVYDKTGKALRLINRKGLGGEEYSNVSKIILDESRNEIYIHDHFQRKIQIYDLFGVYQRSLYYKEHTNGGAYTDIVNYDGGNLLCFNEFSEDRLFVLVSKHDGSIVREFEIPTKQTLFLLQQQISEKTGGLNVTGPGFYSTIIPYNKEYILLDPSSDTIYTISSDNKLKPFIVRTPQIESMDPKIYLILRLVTNNYIFMETIKNEFDWSKDDGFPRKYFMYDIRQRELLEYRISNGDYVCDKEFYMSIPRYINPDGELCQTMPAHQLVEAYDKGELKGRLKEIAAVLNEDSNPVLMLIKHK